MVGVIGRGVVCGVIAAAVSLVAAEPSSVSQPAVSEPSAPAPVVQEPAAGRSLRTLPASDKPRFELTDKTWPAEVGKADLCLWRDDKLAAVSITIDDNTVPDHKWWLEAGEKYKFRFTWFVISARVGAGNAFFGVWDDFVKLRAAGHDIQSHTVDHFNPFRGEVLSTEENYKQAIPALEAGVPGIKVSTLAYPGGPNAKNDSELAAKYYIAVRGGRGHFNAANQTDYMNVNSISGTPPLELENRIGLLQLIDGKARKRMYRAWACMHFHGLENPREPEKSAKPRLEPVLEYLDKNRDAIWVGTFTEVAKYGQQRDTAALTSAVENGKITLTLTDRMDDALFDEPLTVKVRIDPAWKSVKAVQAEKGVSASVIEHEGARFALVSAVPDRGPVVLTAAE